MTPEEKLQAIAELAGKYSFMITAMLLACEGDISKIPSEHRAVASVLAEIIEIIYPENREAAVAAAARINQNDPKEVLNLTHSIVNSSLGRYSE